MKLVKRLKMPRWNTQLSRTITLKNRHTWSTIYIDVKYVLIYSKSYSGSPSLVRYWKTKRKRYGIGERRRRFRARESFCTVPQQLSSKPLRSWCFGDWSSHWWLKNYPFGQGCFSPHQPTFLFHHGTLSLSLSPPLSSVWTCVSFLFLFYGKKATFLSVQRHAAVLYLFQQITMSVLVKFWLLYCEKRYSRYVSPTLLCIFPTNRFLWRPILAYRSCDR